MSFDLLKVQDVCKRLSISKQTLYNLFKSGKLERVDVLGGVRVPADSLYKFVKSLPRR